MRPRVSSAACFLALASCTTGPAPGSAPSATGSGGQAPTSSSPAPALAALRAAELSRDASSIRPEHLGDGDPATRRAATRALARLGSEVSRGALLTALLDDDPEVTTWAAYGLGFVCKGNEEPTLSALAARLATTPDDARWVPSKQACVRAVGRCGGARAEDLLRKWLSSPAPLPEDAALALSEVARANKTLREETMVELLRVAEGALGSSPSPAALSPFTRVNNVPPAVGKRLAEVATARLAASGPHRIAAIRALARAGAGVRGPLRKILDDEGATAGERAEAAGGLARLEGGPLELAEWAVAHAPPLDAVGLTAVVGGSFVAELSVLRAIPQLPKRAISPEFGRLASLEPPRGAPAAVLRRLSALRCEASRLVSGGNPLDPLFVSCDLQPSGTPGGSIGLRLRVAALDAAPIEGARLALFRQVATGSDLRAREAALGLLARHGEVEDAAGLLAAALGAKEPGVVSAAAEVLAAHPERATEVAPRPKPRRKKKSNELVDDPPKPAGPAPTAKAVIKALLDALEKTTEIEASLALLDAAAALGLEQARPKLEGACASAWPASRDRAKLALRALGKKDAACPAPDRSDPPPEAAHLLPGALTVELETDVGKLRLVLDPSQAPAAVTRIVDLVRSGFYDGMVVHRVVPGFVAQLGSPTFDDVGGPPNLPLLRCETSPAPPFEPLAIGMALSGRDTGSSQIFVMLGPGRHLDGVHSWLGTASGPWGALVEGDLITKAKVL